MDITPELRLPHETTLTQRTGDAIAVGPHGDPSPAVPLAGAEEERLELLLFRVGREQFAVALAAVDEAVELTPVQPVPDMPDAMLGVCDVRGVLVPVYSPARALGAEAVGPRAEESVVLLMRAGGRRVGIVVDDVEDVLALAPGSLLQPALANSGDGVVLGVARVGPRLATVLDPAALLAACSFGDRAGRGTSDETEDPSGAPVSAGARGALFTEIA